MVVSVLMEQRLQILSLNGSKLMGGHSHAGTQKECISVHRFAPWY
jgi:hypothetical protein